MSFKTSERYGGVSETVWSVAHLGDKKRGFSTVCVCVCVCARVCVEWKGSSRYETVLFFFWFVFLGPGGVLVNSNHKIQLFAHRVLEPSFAASLCNLSSLFGKYLFL